MPEDVIFIAVMVLIVLAIAYTAFGRFRGTRGGIAPRSMAGRRRTGGQGAGGPADRRAFDRETDQRGTR